MENFELNNDVTMDAMETMVTEPMSGIGKFIGLGAAALAAIGVGALVVKGKGKLEEYNIKKLEKKGYTVIKPEVEEEEKKED